MQCERRDGTLLIRCGSGHYDILYKIEDLAEAPMPAPPVNPPEVLVRLNHASSDNFQPKFYEANDYEIPGMSTYPGPVADWSSPPQYAYASSPLLPMSTQQVVPTPAYHHPVSPVHSDIFSVAYLPSPTTPSAPVPMPAPRTHSLPIDRDGPFRPSVWEYETHRANAPIKTMMCQTSIFKKQVPSTTLGKANANYLQLILQHGPLQQPGVRAGTVAPRLGLHDQRTAAEKINVLVLKECVHDERSSTHHILRA